MSDTPQRLCATVLSKASSYLDGHLSAKGRRIVQQHLHDCATCMQEIQALAKLSRATHNLPQHRVPSDMASRVRQRMATHREEAVAQLDSGRWRSRAVLLSAAVLLVSVSWATGFWMGQQPDSEPMVSSTQQSETQPTPAALTPRSVDAGAFRLASRNLLQDLAVAPNLPERAREPLIAAQLAYFDLPGKAQPILRSSAPDSTEYRLAIFVTELDAAISREGPVDWLGWHDRAQQRGLLEPLPKATAQLANARPDQRAVTIAERFPSQLSADERRNLADLLVLKHERLIGRVTTSLELIDRWQAEPMQTSPFTLATGTESTRALIEVGRHGDARRMLRVMQTQVRMGSHSVTATSSSAARGEESTQNRAQQLLNAMLRELRAPESNGGN